MNIEEDSSTDRFQRSKHKLSVQLMIEKKRKIHDGNGFSSISLIGTFNLEVVLLVPCKDLGGSYTVTCRLHCEPAVSELAHHSEVFLSRLLRFLLASHRVTVEDNQRLASSSIS